MDLATLVLARGGHQNAAEGACLLEATSYIAGEPWSDHPACVSHVLGAFGRALNDRLGDEDRQKLIPLIPRLIGTAGDGRDEARRYMALDWSFRVATPRWLDAAGLHDRAAALRALPPVVDEATADAARPMIRKARDEAWEARQSARATLKDRMAEELRKRGVSADAAAVADADAVAAAAAVAAADAAADAAWGSPRYWRIYDAVRAKLDPIYREKLREGAIAEARDATNAEAIELLGRMIDPSAVAS